MALRLRRGTDAERLTITPLEGELIYTTDTEKLFIGDGSTAGGNPVDTDSITDELADLTDVDLTGLADGQTIAYNLANTRFEPANLASAVNDLTDVDTTGVSVGDVLKWNGSAFVPGAEGGITEGQTYGINVEGDLTGSVFTDDSTLVIDGLNGNVITDFILSSGLVIEDTLPGSAFYVTINGGGQSRLGLRFTNREIDMSGTGFNHGRIDFERNDINGQQVDAFIRGGTDGIEFRPRGSTKDFPLTARVNITESGDLAIGKATANAKLDVVGNIIASGSIQPGVYADAAARDTALTSPTEGMLVFLQDTQKFVGYVSDTGLAGGGASNSTAGWVDLY
jgi:hypothetical protein